MYPTFFERFENALKDCNVKFKFLPETKDVWAVDYMPLQVEVDKFVRFLYQPPYLTESKKYSKTISDTDKICNQIGIETIKTNIILDGGNIVRSNNKVIMTDRVFIDNSKLERNQLIREIHELLQIDKLYFVPEQPGDFTGHADGMIRFLDEDTVIINDYKKREIRFLSGVRDSDSQHRT